MSSEFFEAFNLARRQLDWWQVVARRMSAAKVVPVLTDAKRVVQFSIIDDAERLENLVLQCLDHSFDVSLQVG